jgi:hypothetical protein
LSIRGFSFTEIYSCCLHSFLSRLLLYFLPFFRIAVSSFKAPLSREIKNWMPAVWFCWFCDEKL